MGCEDKHNYPTKCKVKPQMLPPKSLILEPADPFIQITFGDPVPCKEAACAPRSGAALAAYSICNQFNRNLVCLLKLHPNKIIRLD